MQMFSPLLYHLSLSKAWHTVLLGMRSTVTPPHDARLALKNMEAGTSAQCSPGPFFSESNCGLLCVHGHRGLHTRISWGKLFSPWWAASQKFLSLLKGKWTGCVSWICTGPEVRVCTLPCGHVVSSVACGRGEKREEMSGEVRRVDMPGPVSKVPAVHFACA